MLAKSQEELVIIPLTDQDENEPLIEKPLIENHISIYDINALTSLLKDFSKTSIGRLISFGGFLIAWQFFIREKEENLLLSADFSNMICINAIIRELFRFITNDTKNCMENNDLEKKQEIFLVTHMSALLATIGVWSTMQSYTLILPLVGRSTFIIDELTYAPSKHVINLFFSQLLGVYGAYSLGRDHLTPYNAALMGGGSFMLATYLGVRQFDTSFDGFFFTNMGQNVLVSTLYIAYLQFKDHGSSLFFSLFNYQKYQFAFKHCLSLIKSGLQPASILLMESLNTILISFTLKNKKELSAFQAAIIIPTIFAAIATSLEGCVSVKTIEAIHRFKGEPKHLRTYLQKTMLHSAWMGNIMPILFSITAFIFSKNLIDILVKNTEDNREINEVTKNNFLLVLSLPFLRTLRMPFYGIVTGFKQVDDPFHQKNNTYATLINCSTAILTLLIGVILDKSFEMGAMGYWSGMSISLSLSCILQAILAITAIHHETEKYTNKDIPHNNRSCFSFFSAKKKFEKENLAQGYFSYRTFNC